MPFPSQISIPFTPTAIESLKIGQRGCYGLFRGDQCIYIGKGDIRARLLGHVNGDNPCISLHAPTHFMGLITPASDLADMYIQERRLIQELAPICNEKIA